MFVSLQIADALSSCVSLEEVIWRALQMVAVIRGLGKAMLVFPRRTGR